MARSRAIGGGGGTAADRPSVAAGDVASTVSPVIGAFLTFARPVINAIGSLVYGSGKGKWRFTVTDPATGRITGSTRRPSGTVGTVTPITQGRPPSMQPPLPKPVEIGGGMPGAQQLPRQRMPAGFTRGQIIAYIVSNGFIWAVSKAGEWFKMRAATPNEIETGRVSTPGGTRRQPVSARGMAHAEIRRIFAATTNDPIRRAQLVKEAIARAQERAEQMRTDAMVEKATRERIAREARAPILAPRVSPYRDPVVSVVAGAVRVQPVALPEQLPAPAKATLPTIAPAAPGPTFTASVLKAAGIPSLGAVLPTWFAPSTKARGLRGPLRQALTALNQPGVGFTSSTQASYFAQAALNPALAPRTAKGKCKCPPTRKRKPGPRKLRAVCYKGSYTESARGLSKRRRVQIPCR